MSARLLPKARQAVRRCAKITQKLCESCGATSPSRCCDVLYCEIAAAGLRAVGLTEPARPGRHGVPFLGEQGCALAPEERPFCATFVCDEHLQPGHQAERVRELRGRVWSDPVAALMRAAELPAAVAREIEIRKSIHRAKGEW